MWEVGNEQSRSRAAISTDMGAADTLRHSPLARSSQAAGALLGNLPVAVYTTDAAGRITHFNEAAAALWGRRPELGTSEWCGSWRLYWSDGTPMPHDQCPMAVALKEGHAISGAEAVVERRDGTRVPVLAYPSPLYDASGALSGAVNTLVDITERDRTEDLEQWRAAIVESSSDAIVSKDLNGIITSWNPGAQRLFGYTADEVIGEPVTILIPPDRQDEEPRILERIRRGERVDQYETVRRRKDGRLIDIALTVSPLQNRSGRIIGASKIARDITGRKRTEASLSGQKRILEMLAMGAPLTDVLAALIRFIERQSGGLLASVLVRLPGSDRFQIGVAPSLPGRYVEALCQAPIIPPYLGPCGRATHLGEEVIVADITADSRWSAQWRELALGCDLRACYSAPIVASSGQVLGSFGMYQRQPRDPKPPDQQLLEVATHLAGIAIEHAQAQQALRERECDLRELNQALERRVEKRTARLQRQAARLRYLASELTTAEQRERKRLAALLHDDLQQWLVAAKLRLNQAAHTTRDSAAAAEIEAAVGLLDRAMHSSRHLTRELRPPILYEDGLVSCLRWLATELSKLHGLRVVLDARNDPPLDDDLKALLFDAVRELLFNVVKHAHAREAIVRVWRDAPWLRIDVEDAGDGFEVDLMDQDLDRDTRLRGIGLLSIRERLAALGGDMSVESSANRGTRVHLTIPLPPAGTG